MAWPDIAHHARTLIFVGAFALHERLHARDGGIRVEAQGEPKFVDAVREITFSGPRALLRGQGVWYVTHRGVFRLTPAGLELVQVMPGIEVQRDIVLPSGARIVLPAAGSAAIPSVAGPIVTGLGYQDFLAQAFHSSTTSRTPGVGGYPLARVRHRGQ